MADIVEIVQYNECYMIVNADPGVREELAAYFTFKVPGFQFMPAYKRGTWDGNLVLYNRYTRQLYKGLEKYVERFCADRGYEIINPFDDEKVEVTDAYPAEFAKSIGFPFDLHWYQEEYVKICIESNRSLCLSPTSSGKSAMIYLLHRHYYDKEFERMLLIVPTAGLVHQMAGDFVGYGYDADCIHKISAGAEKSDVMNILIEFEDGSCLSLTGDANIKTLNRGTVKARDLKETDDVDDVWAAKNLR